MRKERRIEEKNLVKIILWPYLNSSFLFFCGGGLGRRISSYKKRTRVNTLYITVAGNNIYIKIYDLIHKRYKDLA